jgi:hypothetical protein
LLTSDNITVVFPTEVGFATGIQVLSIHGANTKGIFDPDPSIPATCFIPACGDCSFNVGTCSVSIQTYTTDFVIVSTAIGDGPACGGVSLSSSNDVGGVPGFTTITTNKGYGGWFEVDYAILSALQSKVVFACNGTFATAIAMDAISLRGAFGS